MPQYKYVMAPEGNRMIRVQLDAQGNPLPTRQEKIEQYYPGYTNEQGDTYSPTKVMQGNGITVTGRRSTPETEPWRYDPSGRDVIAGNDYSRATPPPPGRPGYPVVPKMTEAERQSVADEQSWFTSGRGLDPRLMAGMTKYGPGGDTYSNQYGSYRTPGWNTDPRTGEVTNFYGPSFQGQDQSGGAVDYSGRVPYGQSFMDAVRGMAARRNTPRARTSGSPPIPEGWTPPGGGPGGGGVNDLLDYLRTQMGGPTTMDAPYRDPDIYGMQYPGQGDTPELLGPRGWSNVNPNFSRPPPQTGGYQDTGDWGPEGSMAPTPGGAATPPTNTSGMTALKRALMTRPWGSSGG